MALSRSYNVCYSVNWDLIDFSPDGVALKRDWSDTQTGATLSAYNWIHRYRLELHCLHIIEDFCTCDMSHFRYYHCPPLTCMPDRPSQSWLDLPRPHHSPSCLWVLYLPGWNQASKTGAPCCTLVDMTDIHFIKGDDRHTLYYIYIVNCPILISTNKTIISFRFIWL